MDNLVSIMLDSKAIGNVEAVHKHHAFVGTRPCANATPVFRHYS